MTTRVDDRQLVWQPLPNAYRSSFVASGLGQSQYVLVYQDPCWCVRYEPADNEKWQWMGQFTEAMGGKARAVERAQQHHTKQVRALAWQKYMEEHDPPQEIQE